MSSREFSEWQAFQRLEGMLGPARDDFRAGLIASVIANTSRDPKRHPKAYEPQEFIPDWPATAGWRKPQLSRAEVAEKVKGVFQGLIRRGREAGH